MLINWDHDTYGEVNDRVNFLYILKAVRELGFSVESLFIPETTGGQDPESDIALTIDFYSWLMGVIFKGASVELGLTIYPNEYNELLKYGIMLDKDKHNGYGLSYFLIKDPYIKEYISILKDEERLNDCAITRKYFCFDVIDIIDEECGIVEESAGRINSDGDVFIVASEMEHYSIEGIFMDVIRLKLFSKYVIDNYKDTGVLNLDYKVMGDEKIWKD